MEEGLESSALEDNLDIGLGFGDDRQKVEKMNQSFLLLKKKLIRSHDLIQQYTNKMKECERLRNELEVSQRDSERFKQQHLTATAKVLKLSMDNTKFEESNRTLQKLVTEQEINIAANLSQIQQLNSKFSDMEERHDERVMAIQDEKKNLQIKVKELEQEIKRINKLHGAEIKKLEKMMDGTCSKKGNKKETKSSPLKSPIKSRRIAGLGVIDDDDELLEPQKLSEIPGDFPENVLEDIPEVPKIDPLIVDTKFTRKSVTEIGINVDLSIPLKKPVMIDKKIMTDEFYNIKDNPYPIFCAKCEQLLEEVPEDAISKAMRLPPHITELPSSPVRPIRRQSPERSGFNSPIVLDSLQRRIKLLEKRIKRQKKVDTPKESCCNHSMNHCGHTNSFNQHNQFDMMTEFFGRMMQLPGFQRRKNRGECTKSQKKLFSAKIKKKMKSRTRMKKSKDLSTDNWEVQLDESINENPSRPHTPSSRNSFRNDEHHDPEDDFFNSMSSNRTGKRRRETLDRIINEPRDSSLQRFITPEPETNLFNDNGLSTSQKRKNSELENSTTGEIIPRKKKRAEDPPKPVNNRSNLLKNLRRLKKNNSAVKPLPTIVSEEKGPLEGVNSTEDVPVKKRIAHIPKQSEPTLAPKTTEKIPLKLPQDIPIPISPREKRMTRSLRKSNDDKNRKNVQLNSSKEEIIDDKSTKPDSLTPDTAKLSSIESPVEKNLEIIEETPEMMIIDKESGDMVIDEGPASPSGESSDLPSNIIKTTSIHETTPASDSSDTEELPKSPKPSNCIRELRNRQIHMSPSVPKPMPLFEKEPSPPLELSSSSPPLEEPLAPPPTQKFEKIEDLLDNYLTATKKRRGRKPKTIEAAKILHEKAQKLIKKELQRLIDSPEWEDSLHNEVSLSLSNTKSPRTVAKVVVDFLVDRSDEKEPLDLAYTPPAPPMTKSLQKIVTLLKDLDSKMPELINFVFQAIEFALFRLNSSPGWYAVEELSRLFTVLSRIKKDRERVRIMCCDAAYVLQRKSAIVLHAVLTCWPEVLPMYDAEKSQYLPICLVHVVGMQSTDRKGRTECEQVKRLIKGFFKYPQNEPSELFGCKLLDILGKNYNKCVETAILLLSKKEGTDWAYKHLIQGGLMQMIVEGKSLSIYHPLKLLGYLMRPFPVVDADGSVKKIVEQLRALAEAGTAPEMQEGAISALLSLSRHRFDEIACSVLNWKPKRELPELLMEQMNAFFGARNIQWNNIKLKSHKYASNL